MVKEFLEKYRGELLSLQEEKQKTLDQILTHRQETEKFLKLLESENEEVFSEFTPRNITAKGDEKIAEVKEELEQILYEEDLAKKELSDLKSRLEEVSAAIEELELCEKKEEIVDADLSGSNGLDKTHFRESLQQVLSYLPADPLRAKVELESLLNEVIP